MCYMLSAHEHVFLTIYRRKNDPGMVVGNNVRIAVLWLVDFKVRMFPGELLSWINRLTDRDRVLLRETI